MGRLLLGQVIVYALYEHNPRPKKRALWRVGTLKAPIIGAPPETSQASRARRGIISRLMPEIAG
jgi:hypothetical protein